MISKVIFAGRHTAETCGPWPDWGLISIGEPDSYDGPPKIIPGWRAVLRLSFHDVSPSKEKDGMDALLTYFTEEDAKAVVEFVRRVAPDVEGILIHCRAVALAAQLRLPNGYVVNTESLSIGSTTYTTFMSTNI